MSWSESRLYCKSLEGDLIQPTDIEINKIPEIKVTSAGLWIGLDDNKKEGVFKWDDGLQYKYKNWHGGQPNNYANPKLNQNCVEFQVNDKLWYDISCTLKRPSACAVKGL